MQVNNSVSTSHSTPTINKKSDSPGDLRSKDLLHISFSWKQTCITETLQLRVKHSTAQFLHSGSVQSHTFFIQTQLKHSSSMGPHKPTRQGPCASFWPAQEPQTEETTVNELISNHIKVQNIGTTCPWSQKWQQTQYKQVGIYSCMCTKTAAQPMSHPALSKPSCFSGGAKTRNRTVEVLQLLVTCKSATMRIGKRSTGNLRIGHTRLCNPCLWQPAVSQGFATPVCDNLQSAKALQPLLVTTCSQPRLCNPCLWQPAVGQSLDLQLAHHMISHTVLTIRLALDRMFMLVKFKKLLLQSYFALEAG